MSSPPPRARVERRLVADGTITAEQQDAVAEQLAEQLPPPHHAARGLMKRLALDVAAETLGLSEADLLQQLRDESSLADVAEEQGVAVDELVQALVAAATERIDEALAEGRITNEQAAALEERLAERVPELVEREGLPARGRGHPRPFSC